MVIIKGPLLSTQASGWLGKGVYKIHGIVPNPYPIAHQGRINVPKGWSLSLFGNTYKIPKWDLRPYPFFISQYYNKLGWTYEMRRTWHGLQSTARRTSFISNPNSLYQVAANLTMYDGRRQWASMTDNIKNLYNVMKYPERMSGYNRFIKLYIKEKGIMPINWGREEIVLDIDGGGSALTTGIKADLRIPFPCRIKSWQLLADQVGDIVIDIWKNTYVNFPPTNADSICAGSEPTLSGVAKNKNDTASGFSTLLAEGDILRFNIDSIASITRIHLSIPIEVL